MKLLLIADNDSQLLACEALCQGAELRHEDVTINVIPRDGTPQTILHRIGQRGTVWTLHLNRLINSPRLLHFDAIGVFLTGSKLNDIRLALERRQRRPLLFCGFNGIVLAHFIEGVSWRLGYDLICLGGPRDQQALDQLIANTPYARQRTVLTGLKRNGSVGPIKPPLQRAKCMVFAEQVVMPATTRERVRMIRLLAELAERSPDWTVLIKPRISPGDATFHDVETHISATLQRTLGVMPTNLRLDYRSLPELLSESRLMVTLSSTAFFDALDFGCRPMAMNDFGLQPAYGSHVFVGSGVWRSLAELSDLNQLDRDLGSPDPEWLKWMGYDAQFSPKNLLDALHKLPVPEPQPTPLGYPGSTQSSFNQLRVSAEAAIASNDWLGARELLGQAALMRPMHRGVARRLAAVKIKVPLLRSLGLLISYRNLG